MTVMLYKHPGKNEIDGDLFDWQIIDESQVDALKVDGWELSPVAAKAYYQDNKPLSRDELELKADELGLRYTRRTTDEQLENIVLAEMMKQGQTS